MRHRLVTHLSRYKGPAGDSRPAAEIFKGIEEREKEERQVYDSLLLVLNNALQSRKLQCRHGLMDLLRATFVDWLFENDPDFRTRHPKGKGGENE